jgi:hypothetical protein
LLASRSRRIGGYRAEILMIGSFAPIYAIQTTVAASRKLTVC